LSWGQFAQGAAAAFAGGALAGAAATLGPEGAIIGGGAGSALEDFGAGRPFSLEGTLLGAAAGGVGGYVGERTGLQLSKGLLASDAVRDLARKQEIADLFRSGGASVALGVGKNSLQPRVCK